MDTPLKRSRYDWVVEILSLLGLAWAFFPLFFYGDIGEEDLIPIHYNSHGEVDGWGGRHFLWVLALITSAFYMGLSITERFYRKFNFPVRVTEDNAMPLYRLGVRMVRHLKLFLVFIFAYINNASFAVATGAGAGLNGHVMMVLFGCLILVMVVFIIRMSAYKE